MSNLSSGAALPFRGNSRFDVVRRIGAGGMGVVYEAWDKDRNARVALKTLTGLDPRALHLFKNEFRALTDVSHFNLAALYELFSEQGQWFFSMEYVEGGHFLEYIRPAPAAEAVGLDEPTVSLLPLQDRCDIERLTAILGQLTRAVMALHGARILHRDLKPLNVKVTPEGRVVVLDFGLAAHAGPAPFADTDSHAVVGTVPYMSPEQAFGSHVTEATDWYAVGVMVYEALTGQRPFEGAASQVLHDKQCFDAPRVTLLADVSDEWEAICAGLLERDPARRKKGADLLAILERQAPPPAAPAAALAASQAKPAERIFVGRDTHLALLREAFAATEANIPSLVFVHGNSGIGKSSLVERFLAEAAGRARCVILAGRCYERESMPYKAFDSVVDSLARYMSTLPRHEAGELTPREAAALAQVFPVLRQVETIAGAPQRSAQVLDQHELRRKAFAALRELLARLGDRRRVVIYIDDLQWGDVDSAALLREILQPPDAPAFLLIGSYRSEYEGRTPALDALLTGIPDGPGLQRRDLLVGPLNREETRTLALRLLSERARDVRDPERRIEEIARESEGSPYLLQEIAAGSEFDAEEIGGAAGMTLDEVLYKRIAALPEDPRRLLETVAVSVRPLGEREALRAARVDSQDQRALVELRAARLIRGAGASGEIEPYHDRVRETVVAHLPAAALTECHLRLATTLEAFLQAGGWVDVEAAAVHFEGAGEKDKAAHYYAAAAERASAALAFKHAAELCQRALDLSPLTGEPRRLLVVRLADALGNAGRGPEAARAYREAARGAQEPEVFDLERKQAYWFASSGHVDEGREALLNMLRRVDVRIPGPLGRLAGIVFAGLRVMLRGTQFRERPESEIPREELDRIDVHWDAMRSFSMIDVPAAIYLTPRCLLLALRAGEIGRIARVLAFHSIGTAAFRMPGPRSRIARQMALCIALSEKTRVRYLGGMYRLAGGLIDCVMGRWRESLRKFEEAERIFSQECAGAAWELATVRIYTLWDLLYAGQYRELCRRAPLWSQDGAERGDLFQAVTIDAGPRAVCELIAGRPDAAMRLMDESLQRWTQRNYNVQLAAAAFVRVWIYLYQGRADAAWESLNREWPLLRTNHYLRLSGIRQWLYSARAQCALALAGAAADSGALLDSAERDARQLEADEAPFAHILGRLVRAGCAARRGDRENATALLGKAADEFDAADMAMMAAAARRRLGELTVGESGRALIEQAELAMKSEEVRDPARLTAMFANGFMAAD